MSQLDVTSGCGRHLLSWPQNGCKWTAMRHGNKKAKLGRPADQRKALLRALTTELLRHGKIKTTKVQSASITQLWEMPWHVWSSHSIIASLHHFAMDGHANALLFVPDGILTFCIVTDQSQGYEETCR